MEGESLFNDATAIALSRLLLGILLVGGASEVTTEVLATAVLDFAVVFAGGLALGWGAAVIVGLILGWVEDNPFIEISLTTVLAYLAFIVAEEGLAVSGVMAVLISGIVIGGWGKAKVSPSVAEQLEGQWSYLGGRGHVARVPDGRAPRGHRRARRDPPSAGMGGGGDAALPGG